MDQAHLLLCSMWYRVCLPLYIYSGHSRSSRFPQLFRTLEVEDSKYGTYWRCNPHFWFLSVTTRDSIYLSLVSDCYVFPGITFVCRSQHWTIRFKSLRGNSCGCPEIFFIFFTEVRLPHSVSYYPSIANMIDSPCDYFWLLGDFVLSTEGS